MLREQRLLTVARVIATALLVLVAIRVSWVSDDALITLRTVLNITHEWGPGYNATEAVQAYTHPLWFLIWVSVGTLTDQWIYGILFVGAVFVGIAVGLLLWRTLSIGRIILVTSLLLLSNSFIDYTSSGLENPLSYALIAIVMSITMALRRPASVTHVAVVLGLSVAATLLTRLDLLLLILLPVAYVVFRDFRAPRAIAGFFVAFLTPLAVWYIWSWLAYSAFLPNTYAAKTNVHIPRAELLAQGLRYLWVSFEHDPVSLIALVLGIGVGAACGTRMVRLWTLGVVLYLGYVLWVGGDFMAGRFFSVPVFVSVFIFAVSQGHRRGQAENNSLQSALVGTSAVASLLLMSLLIGTRPTALDFPVAPRWEVDQNLNAGVSDELGVYAANGRTLESVLDNLSLAYVNPDIVPIGDGTGLNRTLREIDKAAKNWPTNDGSFSNPSEVGVFCGFLGTVGIATGPITHLIDSCALTDRYLAERPSASTEPFAWKPGHFYREIPAGYEEAVASGDPRRVTDAVDQFRLRQVWERIR